MDSLFVHLRVHSAYSVAESMLQVGDLVRRVAAFNQPALAITDSFNNFGALEFSAAAMEAGVQPILGVQADITDGAATTGEVVLLVQNERGWINLSQMLSDALLADNQGEAAAITIDALERHHEGLILLTGGARRGFIGGAAADGQIDLARGRLARLASFMAGRIYIELQRHGTPRELRAEPILLDLAYDMDLPLIATNDCYFAESKMAAAHEILLCISAGATRDDDNRRRETDQHYLKSSPEMIALFADIPEAIANTVVVAKRCAFAAPRRSPILPTFAVPDGMGEGDYLRAQSSSGLDKRFTAPAFAPIASDPEQVAAYRARLDFELGIIIEMGFAGYFLIVSDFIAWAKDHDIPVGPGRGSGAGSLVAYALGITDLDPIRWGLLFERFLNPERISMPDFDIDFCQDRRDEVIGYVQRKYGADRVAQIITFGTLKARAVLRDVGRIMGLPYGQVDRIAKLVPSDPANPLTLEQALEKEQELRTERDQDENIAELLKISIQLEGLYRHVSTHAAGVVIGDRPLPELVPLYRDPNSTMPVTQFNMQWVEKAGLVKFDFLGLKTLTVLQQTIEFIRQRGGDLTLDDIPLSDDATFARLSKADTVGIFQLESGGMQDVLRGLKPDRFEDITAVVALYRPGPMENIPSYVRRKHGEEEIKYLHPLLEPILSETYGIMIYQEQVQRAAQVLAGYSLGGADILRRAMGKKDQKVMNEQRANFVEGAGKNDISPTLASKIFENISAFAGYGFNKSHAAAYALVAWQTAYLKTHYGAEFLAASMNLDAGRVEKLAIFKQDSVAHGIAVLPPDVNQSSALFTVEGTKDAPAIRYGLGAIRNVGTDAMAALVSERQGNGVFQGIDDFAVRTAKTVSRRPLEGLIKSGAFDSLVGNRQQLMEGVEGMLSHGQATRGEIESGQSNLFGGGGEEFAYRLPQISEFTDFDKLKHEFDALGLYLSAHPMDAYADRLKSLSVTAIDRIADAMKPDGIKGGGAIKLAGMVVDKKIRTSQRGDSFAIIQLADQTGSCEIMLFSETYNAARDFLTATAPLLLHITAEDGDRGLRLQAHKVSPLDDALDDKMQSFEAMVTDSAALAGISDCLMRDGRGKGQMVLVIKADGYDVRIALAGGYRLSEKFRQAVRSLKGVAFVRED